MSEMASQITSLIIVYSTVYSSTDQRKHQSSVFLALCAGNSPVTGEFPAQRASYAENISIWWRHHVDLQPLCTRDRWKKWLLTIPCYNGNRILYTTRFTCLGWKFEVNQSKYRLLWSTESVLIVWGIKIFPISKYINNKYEMEGISFFHTRVRLK